jgi:spermidine synthase
MFALTLGHEFPAIVTTVAAFFLGMAIGGIFANKILERLGPKAFARLEFLIGICGLIAPQLILKLGTNHLAVLAIMPSTILMGATLPAMARLAQIPAAYAANTFGAVIGCLATAFLFMPKLGFVTPSVIWAACNFMAAFLARRFAPKPLSKPVPLQRRLAVTFFATGFLALAFETIGVRLLSMSLEDTIFTFAAILAVYLFGQSLGAAFFRKRADVLLALLTIAMALAIWLFSSSGSFYEILRGKFGDSPLAVSCAEILTTLIIFIAPTFLMGAFFAELAENVGERSLGKALLWNSAGACLGAVIAPAMLLPNVGAFWTLTILAVGYFALTKKWEFFAMLAAIVAIVILCSAPRPLLLVRIPPAQTLREVRVGRMATVAVAETPDGSRTLFVNNRFQMGGTAATIPELRHADIPLLLRPSARRALFLGLGTGITLSAAVSYPDLQADGVELLPEVLAVMPNFFPNGETSPLEAQNISLHIADARRFIRETTNLYDVIIADLFHPAQDGAAFLYTREHFGRIGERLADDGLFCQWLPLHQLDLQAFRDITRTFLTVFPQAEAWLLRPNIDAPVVALIGYKRDHPPFSPNLVEDRLEDPKLAAQLRHVALADSVRLLGSFLAGPEALRKFSAEGRLNTDTHPVVMFEAPRFSFLRDAPTYERLMAVLAEITDKTPPIADATLRQKVERCIRARDVYLNALVVDSKNDRARAIDGYIESARISEDFTSGYAQCLAIATAEAKANPSLARSILQRLAEAQPNRPVAREMLDRLSR